MADNVWGYGPKLPALLQHLFLGERWDRAEGEVRGIEAFLWAWERAHQRAPCWSGEAGLPGTACRRQARGPLGFKEGHGLREGSEDPNQFLQQTLHSFDSWGASCMCSRPRALHVFSLFLKGHCPPCPPRPFAWLTWPFRTWSPKEFSSSRYALMASLTREMRFLDSCPCPSLTSSVRAGTAFGLVCF